MTSSSIVFRAAKDTSVTTSSAMASSSWQHASDVDRPSSWQQVSDVDRPNFALIPVPLDQDDLDEVADAINRKRFVDHYAKKIQAAVRRFLAYKNREVLANIQEIERIINQRMTDYPTR